MFAIIDNHASMEAQGERGLRPSALDMTKAGLEAFLSVYGKHMGQGGKPIPMMLLESGQDKSCILSHISDTLQSFETQVKTFSVRGDGETATNFSYSISQTFSILNKLRIKNDTDRFGYGRCPWVLEPASILLFTNGNPQDSSEFELLTKWKTLSEYINEIYKWDHRVFLFVMNNQEDPSKCTAPAHLASLCTMTGGEVSFCKTMKDAYDTVKTLSTRLLNSHPSVAIKFSVVCSNKGAGGADELETALNTSIAGGIQARLVVKSTGEWPIPERGWIDIRDQNGKLPIRDAIPQLTVLKGNYSTISASKGLLQLAKESDVHVDSYEVTLNGGRSLDLDKHECYPVFVAGSWRHLDASLGEGSSTACPPEPFAILSTGTKPGVYQLAILPFNYPKCLPLLKQALDPIKAGKSHQDLNTMPWVSQWRIDFTSYLQSVPPYYYPQLARLLKKHQILKILFPGNQQHVLDYELHRKPGMRMKKAQNEALMDVGFMEIVARDRWPKPTPPANAVALACSAHVQQTLPVGAASMSMPKAVSDIHESELLCVWEKMRQSIFGGGSGLTVRGLSVPGIVGTSGRACTRSLDAHEDWLKMACGGSTVPRETTRDMSNYFAVLAKQECPRDPLIDTPDDEDTELGILKRKLSPPNFGNRYGGKKSKTSSEFEIEGIVAPTNTIFQSSAEIISTAATPLSLEETATSSAQSLFMDTPSPYLDDNYPPSCLEDGDAMEMASEDTAPVSLQESIAAPQEEAAAMDTTTASAGVLQPREHVSLNLGNPRKTGPRPHSLPFANAAAARTASTTSSASSVPTPAASSGLTTAAVSFEGDSAAASPTSVVDATVTQQSPSSTPEASASAPASPSSTTTEESTSSTGAVATGEEWVKHFSSRYNRVFWFQPASGKSVWVDPYELPK